MPWPSLSPGYPRPGPLQPEGCGSRPPADGPCREGDQKPLAHPGRVPASAAAGQVGRARPWPQGRPVQVHTPGRRALSPGLRGSPGGSSRLPARPCLSLKDLWLSMASVDGWGWERGGKSHLDAATPPFPGLLGTHTQPHPKGEPRSRGERMSGPAACARARGERWFTAFMSRYPRPQEGAQCLRTPPWARGGLSQPAVPGLEPAPPAECPWCWPPPGAIQRS